MESELYTLGICLKALSDNLYILYAWNFHKCQQELNRQPCKHNNSRKADLRVLLQKTFQSRYFFILQFSQNIHQLGLSFIRAVPYSVRLSRMENTDIATQVAAETRIKPFGTWRSFGVF